MVLNKTQRLRLMKIQTRTLLYLSTTMGLFMGAVIGYEYFAFHQKKKYIENEASTQNLLIKQALNAASGSINTMVSDYSAWDDFVEFCKNPSNKEWAHNNLDYILKQYNLHYLWVYDSHFKPCYVNIDSFASIPAIHLDSKFFESIFRNKTNCSFCLNFNDTIVEFKGSNIVMAFDNEARKTPSQGYFLVARLLNENFIHDIEKATGLKVQLLRNGDSLIINTQNEQVVYTHKLFDKQKELIASIIFIGNNELNANFRYFYQLIIGLFVISILIYIFHYRVIKNNLSLPLNKIVTALDTGNSQYVLDLKSKQNEFGQIAKSIEAFFEQRDVLNQLNLQLLLQKEEIDRTNVLLKDQNELIIHGKEELHEKSTKLDKTLKQLEYHKYSIDETAVVIITDINGDINYVNDKFCNVSGYSRAEVIGKNPRIFQSEIHDKDYYKSMWHTLSVEKTKWRGEICELFKDGSEHWFDMTIVPFLDDNNEPYQFLAIKFDITEKKEVEQLRYFQNEELSSINLEIEKIHYELTSSIHYAKNIQHAMMHSEDLLDMLLPRYFVIYKPKNIVSGDFYWVSRDKNKLFVAIADCTGHGVPGAFMSMLGISLLNELKNKDIEEPALILNKLRKSLKASMHQSGREYEQKDGMDIALCVINLDTMMLKFSGANRHLYLVRKSDMKFNIKKSLLPIKRTHSAEYDLIEIKGDKMPIGVSYDEELSFSQIEIPIEKRDTFYLLTDGFYDQFGGENHRKFSSRRLKEQLLAIQKKGLQEQKTILEETFNNWQGAVEQTDDMLLLGLRF
jgi:PAS domain S-box-containing protein